MNACDLTTAIPSNLDVIRGQSPGAALHVVYPNELQSSFVLNGSRVVLGRRPGADGAPSLSHKLVSREHFAVQWDIEQQCHVGEDLNSQNGSFVDGNPARGRIPLRDGSVIRIGGVLLVYERLDDTAGLDAPAVSLEALPGRAVAMRRLRRQLAHVAQDSAAVLIRGPTGTGKEFVAREIHRMSGRAGAFVAINCAALAAHLVESELFGHVRGAFSGAHAENPGLIRAADDGTLLLDEIGELPLELQAKLLRVLQDKRVRPVGGTRDQFVDVRVLASTLRDLTAMVDAGAFRRDLLARLSPWELSVPALRSRRSDILTWLERLHAVWHGDRAQPVRSLRELRVEAAEAVVLFSWPDNLRGLQRLVYALDDSASDAGVRDRRPVRRSELPAWIDFASTPRDLEPHAGARSELEDPIKPRPPIPDRAELTAALQAHAGSVRATALYFRRERRQIYRWIEAYGLKSAPLSDCCFQDTTRPSSHRRP